MEQRNIVCLHINQFLGIRVQTDKHITAAFLGSTCSLVECNITRTNKKCSSVAVLHIQSLLAIHRLTVQGSVIAPIRNKTLHVFLYSISSSLLHTLHSSVRINILGKWGQLFFGQSILNECIVNLCRCQALLVQFLKGLLEHIVAIHRCIKGLLCVAKVAQLINYHAAIRVVRSQTILLCNRLTLAGRLVCVWLSARKKSVFKLALHIIEDFVLLVGAFHRVFAHDVVNINRHVSLVVDHLLQGVHKTTNNVGGFYFKIAIRTVNVHILLPVKIERTLRVAQVINQLGVYRVCNILARVIAFITEEAKCQTGNISVLISQLHILHL